MSWTRRLRLTAVLATLALAVALLAPGGQLARPAGAGSSDVGQYLSLLNQARANAGVAPLRLDGELSGAAAYWAGQLASMGRLQHASDLSTGIGQPWVKLGENVGRGPDTPTIHAAFLASPTHYQNVVDPAFEAVGIGVVWSGGTQYVVHRFLDSGGGGGGGGGGSSSGGGGRGEGSGTSAATGASAAPAPEPEPPAPPPPPPPPPPGPGDPVRAAAMLQALHEFDR